MTIVSKPTCTMLKCTCDTTDRNKQLGTASGGMRIQRTFSKITSKSNKGDESSDVSTTSSSKKLPGRSYGSTLPETSTLCRIHYHRPVPQMPVEINEIGSTIQQGVIQRPVQRDTQAIRSRRSTPPMNTQQTTSVPNLQITGNGGTRERDKLLKQEGDLNPSDYVLNCIHKNRPFTLNDVARPVFVNHYYAGEAFIPATSKKLIKLDECDVSIENSLRNAQPQGIEHEYREHSQNSWITQQQNRIERGQAQ